MAVRPLILIPLKYRFLYSLLLVFLVLSFESKSVFEKVYLVFV